MIFLNHSMTNFDMSALKLLGCCLRLFLFVGCSNHAASVSGNVTLDGKPLTKGDISFYASGAAAASGQIDASGNYTLSTGTEKGLQPGSYQVTIVANDIIEPTDKFASLIPKLITPAKYSNATTSGLTAEVKSGKNTFDFNLVSTP